MIVKEKVKEPPLYIPIDDNADIRIICDAICVTN